DATKIKNDDMRQARSGLPFLCPVTQTGAVNPFSRPRYHKRRPSTRSAGPGNSNGGRQPAQPAPVTQTAAGKPFSRPRYHKRRPSSRSAGPGNANGGRQAVQPAPVSQTAAVNPFSRPRYHKRRPSTRSAGRRIFPSAGPNKKPALRPVFNVQFYFP